MATLPSLVLSGFIKPNKVFFYIFSRIFSFLSTSVMLLRLYFSLKKVYQFSNDNNLQALPAQIHHLQLLFSTWRVSQVEVKTKKKPSLKNQIIPAAPTTGWKDSSAPMGLSFTHRSKRQNNLIFRCLKYTSILQEIEFVDIGPGQHWTIEDRIIQIAPQRTWLLWTKNVMSYFFKMQWLSCCKTCYRGKSKISSFLV